MKRFVVMKEVWYPDPENGPEFDTQSYEPCEDFSTKFEADKFVSEKKYPSGFIVYDMAEASPFWKQFLDDHQQIIQTFQTFGEQDAD